MSLLAQDCPLSVLAAEGRRGSGGARRLTRADLGWPLLLGFLLALSPLTGSARLGPSMVLGGGATVVALARRARRPWVERAAARARVLATPPPSVWLVLGATGLVFAPLTAWLASEYTESVWRNAHGLFVPLAMVLLGRAALRRCPPAQAESSAWGFAFLVPALALVVLDAGIRSNFLAALGLVLALPGLSLLLLGASRTRRLIPALSLGLFLIPIPAGFENPLGLPEMTAAAIEPLATQLGISVLRHHAALHLNSGDTLLFTQNCSGLSALHGGLALGALFALTARSRLRGALLLLSVYPLVIGLNTLRGLALVVISSGFGVGFLATPLHGLSGIAVVAGVGAILWLGADRRGLREALA